MRISPFRFVRRALFPVVLLAFCLSLSACPSCSQQVDEGDAFVVILDASPKGLDPRFATSDSSAKIVGLLHAGLVSLDTANGDRELRLAHTIEQTSPVRYEVELRDDIYFHDGTPVTSADVEYTYMELDSELVRSPFAGLTRRIERFEVLDERRFVITLKAPHAPFMSDMALGIVPRHQCAGFEECPGAPLGAGPFAYVSQQGDMRVELRAFDDYFEGRPSIDRLVFKVVRDDNARLLALLGNTADLVQNAVAPLMLPVVEDSDRLETMSTPSFKYTYLAFNLEHEILKDLRVREAIAHAIDREAIIKHKFRGAARLSTGMLAPEHWAYESNVKRFDFDPERARQILDEAGYAPGPDGVRFELDFKISASKFRRSMAELIAQQLGEVGIAVRVRSYEWGTFFHDVRSRNFAMTTLQWPSVLEPSLYRWIFHSDNIPSPDNRAAGANRGAYRNARIDELLEAGDRETDPDKRRAIYSEVQQILARELPYVSLWHEDNIAVLRKGTERYYTTPNARFDALKQVVPAHKANIQPTPEVQP
ncbi:ABC transporter substrate-binding protein [Lujinxingia sediminis]|uniref:ABC transporter substrate-binding protein n=1 Tax=Lujinxingia sediminis TaxID=2480984 RepID=A0ABY0CWG6_9DELT|nr:ABC transporter substrate-binding protein [Lujinxingia sediminis]RVU47901.1 ABC transporter substrate-binding protein [Lujinxingia sediminis]